MNKKIRPDDVCEKYSKIKPKLKLIEEDGTIFIQGDSIALHFLAELLIAQAVDEKDDGFQISPNGPGKIFFTKDSTLGVYIHRTGIPMPMLSKGKI